MDLYTLKRIGKIRISCKDLPQPHRTENEQVYCKKVTMTSNKPIGGYTLPTGPSYEEGTIIMCDPFFASGQEHLLAIITHLDDHPEEQHSPLGMSGKAHILLHELTHLSSIEGQNEGEWTSSDIIARKGTLGTPTLVIIKDQVLNEKALRPDKVCGLYWAQRMGDSFKQRVRTHLNGKQPTKALNIILENSQHGVPNDADFYDKTKWLFFSVPYGTASQCQGDSIPVAEAPSDKSLSLRKPQFSHGMFEVKTQWDV